MSRGSQPSHLGSHFVAPERRWYSLVSPACAASISDRSQKAPLTCTEAGSYLRLIDSCITQPKAQGPSRTCNESKEASRIAARRRRSPAMKVDVRLLLMAWNGAEGRAAVGGS